MNKPLNPWKLAGYKAGQSIVVKIVAAEPGGYSVIIEKDKLPGFLPTEVSFKTGEEVLAQFVCVHNNRILLSSRFATATQGTQNYEVKNWSNQEVVASPEGAFQVWAETSSRPVRLRRATDLIIPPLSESAVHTFKIGDYDLEWLLTDLEGGMRTCCIKSSSPERLSRAAALVYKGRAVGCIYGAKDMTDQHPTEVSLNLMMKDLELSQTQVTIYDLPVPVILSMSALFLGYPVQRSDHLDARSYVDYLIGWFAQKQQTACLAISLSKTNEMLLVLVHNGQFAGSFHVEEQQFSDNDNQWHQLLADQPQSNVEASILPPEMISSVIRFGFSLSLARKHN